MSSVDELMRLADALAETAHGHWSGMHLCSQASLNEARAALRSALEAAVPQTNSQMHCGPCKQRCINCPIDWSRFHPSPEQKDTTP